MNWLVTLVFSGHLSTGLQTAIHFGAKSPFFPRSFSPICFPYLFPLFFPICFPYFSLFVSQFFPMFSLRFPYLFHTCSIVSHEKNTEKSPPTSPHGAPKRPPGPACAAGRQRRPAPCWARPHHPEKQGIGGKLFLDISPQKMVNNGYIPLKVIFMVINMVIFTINIVIFTINNWYYHSYIDFHDQLMVIYPI